MRELDLGCAALLDERARRRVDRSRDDGEPEQHRPGQPAAARSDIAIDAERRQVVGKGAHRVRSGVIVIRHGADLRVGATGGRPRRTDGRTRCASCGERNEC